MRISRSFATLASTAASIRVYNTNGDYVLGGTASPGVYTHIAYTPGVQTRHAVVVGSLCIENETVELLPVLRLDINNFIDR